MSCGLSISGSLHCRSKKKFRAVNSITVICICSARLRTLELCPSRYVTSSLPLTSSGHGNEHLKHARERRQAKHCLNCQDCKKALSEKSEQNNEDGCICLSFHDEPMGPAHADLEHLRNLTYICFRCCCVVSCVGVTPL